MAPRKQETKAKNENPAQSSKIVKTESRYALLKTLDRKKKSFQRMATQYNKATPEKKAQIDEMRKDIEQLQTTVDEMDVDEPEPAPAQSEGKALEPQTQLATGEPVSNNEAAFDSKNNEGLAVSEKSSTLAGSSLESDSGPPDKSHDPAKTPGSPGSNDSDQPLLEKRGQDKGEQPHKAIEASSVAQKDIRQSIEHNEEDESLFHGNDETPEPEDPEYGPPLLNLGAKGSESRDGGRTVARCGDSRRRYINLYGEKGAGMYALEYKAFPSSYADTASADEDAASAKNRYGDTLPGVGRINAHAKPFCIWAVALTYKGSWEKSIEAIEPPVDGRMPDAYVLMGWMIDGQKVKAWETRSAYRKLVGHHTADENIYNAACKAYQRYCEAQGGHRRDLNRSPSAPLLDEDTGRSAGRTRGLLWSKGGSTRTRREPSMSHQFPLTPRSSVSPRRKSMRLDDLEEEEFLDTYLRFQKVDHFSKLTPMQQKDCIESLNLHKAHLETGMDEA